MGKMEIGSSEIEKGYCLDEKNENKQ